MVIPVLALTLLTSATIQSASSSVCVVSHWSEWSACFGSCHYGEKVRNRRVTRPPFPERNALGDLVMRECPHLYDIDFCTPPTCFKTNESTTARKISAERSKYLQTPQPLSADASPTARNPPALNPLYRSPVSNSITSGSFSDPMDPSMDPLSNPLSNLLSNPPPNPAINPPASTSAQSFQSSPKQPQAVSFRNHDEPMQRINTDHVKQKETKQFKKQYGEGKQKLIKRESEPAETRRTITLGSNQSGVFCSNENRRCCRVQRLRCPNGAKPQMVTRWFRKSGEDACRSYQYPYCGTDAEAADRPIKYQKNCLDVCFSIEELRQRHLMEMSSA